MSYRKKLSILIQKFTKNARNQVENYENDAGLIVGFQSIKMKNYMIRYKSKPKSWDHRLWNKKIWKGLNIRGVHTEPQRGNMFSLWKLKRSPTIRHPENSVEVGLRQGHRLWGTIPTSTGIMEKVR
jgi:hypothetical protein